MNFGQALEALKTGEWIARAGWNGKGMHLYLEDSLTIDLPRLDARGRPTHQQTRRYEPCIVMFTAQEKHQPGWLASQADMLADDWQIVNPAATKQTQPHALVDGFPRRNRIDLQTPAEKAIRDAVQAVEEAGADERLTSAVILLGEALDKVADYVEAP